MDRDNKKSKIVLTLSMLIFGTIGIFRRHIPLPSSMIAMSRGFIGMVFLLILILLRGKRISFKAIKSNLLFLCLSGTLLGFNWILLFEAYQYTSVATATLCYYMAPIFVILVSPYLLEERLSRQKGACIVVALIGMVFVSGVLELGGFHIAEMKGILLGLGAAIFYAGVVIFNKKIKGIAAYDRTIVQLGISAFVLLPYTVLTERLQEITVTPGMILLLILVGIIHTGIAYALYFGSMVSLKAQTVALFSYIDPIAAILLSAIFLKESMGIMTIIGAVLVLGSTFVSEFVDGI